MSGIGSSHGQWMRLLALASACACAWATSAVALEEESRSTGILTVIWENDWVALQDRHYTNGLRVSWLALPGAPGWLESIARGLPSYSDSAPRLEYAIGQNMYTPSDDTRLVPDPNDRPYAGWLYGSIGLVVNGATQLDQLHLTLGVVGPASGARPLQRVLHDATGSKQAKGWGSQLKNEPGANLLYEHIGRMPIVQEAGGPGVEFLPHAGAALGSIYTYANAGFTLRIGQRIPDDFGLARIEPSVPGSSYYVARSDFGWYCFAGLDGRLVAHNIFLDGNSFRAGPSVDKQRWVADVQAGVALTWREARIGYTHVFRSREFQTQRSRDQFGSVMVSVGF